eukprot:TRINITY_DN1662_c0_g1_i1.p1 TRINITY_DN1662_c0_g1~~TRINITY_DN1662_c0_g1_i1.p1  ORF type:complete len:1538 (+),score=403.10 TRINITY_DN1662_c0_g1_i1:8455-13068(+)
MVYQVLICGIRSRLRWDSIGWIVLLHVRLQIGVVLGLGHARISVPLVSVVSHKWSGNQNNDQYKLCQQYKAEFCDTCINIGQKKKHYLLIMTTPPTQGAAPPPAIQKKGILGKLQGLLSVFKRKPKAKEMDLGNKNQYVFDKNLGRWIIPGQPLKEEDDAPPPPTIGAMPTTIKKDAEKTGKGKKKSKPRYAAGPIADSAPEPEDADNFNKEAIPQEKLSGEDKPETTPKEDTKTLEFEESANNSSIMMKRSEIRDDRSEEMAFLAARNRELEQQLDEAEQKANEAEFLLKEYIDEIESENIQYEEEAKSLFNEKAFMSVTLQAKEKEIVEYKEKLSALEKVVEDLKKERENYLQLILKDEQSTARDEVNVSSEEEEEEKEASPEHNKKLMEAEEELFQLRCKLQEYERTIEENEELISELKTDNYMLKENIEAREDKEKIEKLTNECAAKDEELTRLKNVVEERIQMVTEELQQEKGEIAKRLESEIKRLNEEAEELKHVANEKDETIQKLYAETSDKESELKADVEKYSGEVERLQEELNTKVEQWKSIADEKEEIIKKLSAESLDKESVLKETTQKHSSKAERLQKELDEMEGKWKEFNELYSEASTKRQHTENELLKKCEELSSTEKKLSDSLAQFDKLTQEKVELKQLVENAEKELKTNQTKFENERAKFQKHLSEEDQKHKDAVSRLQLTIKQLQEKNSFLEASLEKAKRLPVSEEQLVKLKEYYDQQIIALYTELNANNESYYAQYEKELQELSEENSKVNLEAIRLKTENEVKAQLLELVQSKLVQLAESCGIQSVDKAKEVLYTIPDTLGQYIRRLEQELEHQKLATNIEENRHYILECCLDEAKAEMQKQTALFEEKADEARYYQELSHIYAEQSKNERARYNALVQENAELEQMVESLRKECEENSQKLMDAMKERKDLMQEIEKQRNISNELDKELQIALKEEKDATSIIEGLRQEIKKHEKEKATIQENNENQKQEIIDNYSKSMKALEDVKGELEGKLKAAQKETLTQIENMRQEINKLEKEKATLKENMEKQKQDLINAHTQSLKALEESKAQLERELKAATLAQVESLEQEIKKLENENGTLSSQLATEREALEEAKKAIKENKTLAENYNGKVQELKKQIQDLENEKEQLLNLCQNSEVLKAQLAEYKEKLAKISKEAEEHGKLHIEHQRKENEKLKTEIEGLGKQVVELKAKEKELENKLQHANKASKEKAEECESLKKEIDRTRNQMEEAIEGSKGASQEAEFYEGLYKEANEKYSKTVNEVEKCVNEIKELKGQLMDSKQEIAQLESKNEKLSKEIEGYEMHARADGEAESKVIDNLRSELASTKNQLQKAIEDQKIQALAYEASIKKLQEALNSASKDKQDLLSQKEVIVKDMETKLQNATHLINEYKEETNNVLQKLRANGEDFKIYYADFKDKPIRFASYVVEKMSAHIKQLSASLKKIYYAEEPKSPQTAPTSTTQIKAVEEKKPSKEEVKKVEAQKKSGISSWLGSFFLTEKELNDLKGPKQIQRINKLLSS